MLSLSSSQMKGMAKLMVFIKRLFCKHKYRVIRNIYGDEINFRNGRRTELACFKCGKIKYHKDFLVTYENASDEKGFWKK